MKNLMFIALVCVISANSHAAQPDPAAMQAKIKAIFPTSGTHIGHTLAGTCSVEIQYNGTATTVTVTDRATIAPLHISLGNDPEAHNSMGENEMNEVYALYIGNNHVLRESNKRDIRELSFGKYLAEKPPYINVSVQYKTDARYNGEKIKAANANCYLYDLKF